MWTAGDKLYTLYGVDKQSQVIWYSHASMNVFEEVNSYNCVAYSHVTLSEEQELLAISNID